MMNKEMREINKSLNELKKNTTKWSKRPLTNGSLLKLYGIATVIGIAVCAIPLVYYKIKNLVRNKKRKEDENPIAD